MFLFSALKAAFDEKNLFPKYILDYESKMRSMQISGVAAAVAVAGNAGVGAIWNFVYCTYFFCHIAANS